MSRWRTWGVLPVEESRVLKGEMLAVRAFLHFDMLRLFGLFLFEEKEIFYKIFRQYGRKIDFYWKNCANFIEKSETG